MAEVNYTALVLAPEAVESAALARARIAELENEVTILRKATAAVEQVVPQKPGSSSWPAVGVLAQTTMCYAA